MTPAPFHAECIADVARGLERTCPQCIAEAQRSKCAEETVDGYLLCVAALGTRPQQPEADAAEGAMLRDWFRARQAIAAGGGNEERAQNIDRLALAALRGLRAT